MRYSLRRRAFSLVELLVVITIILVLMGLTGAAVSAARSSGAKQKTAATIAIIDAMLRQHLTSMESSRAGADGPAADRAALLRRQTTADMPDSWAEVQHIKSQPQQFNSARHRGYVTLFDAATPTSQFGDAECLFMIVMQGGLADCLACSALDKVKIGDKDQDGALEFWDEWGEPIHYVLWPGGFELPVGTKFFSTVPPFSGAGSTGDSAGPMRPLIYSNGPDGKDGLAVHGGAYLALGNNCGVPTEETIATLGGPINSSGDHRDNITNFAGEARR